jgi:hypothetical protein
MWLAGALAIAFVLGLLAIPHTPAEARHRVHTGVYFSFGPYWGWPHPYPYWAFAPPSYYVYPPPPVVVQEPQVYIQREPAPPVPEGPYWYYCESARAYYPSVATCPEPWIRVPPRP